MTETLTKDDVARLLADPSTTTRAATAAKVARHFGAEGLTDSERRLAEAIVTAMARDAAQLVRATLADNIKSAPNLPHDVAVTLAKDVEAVALPILQASTVLTEDDLVEIVRAGSDAKQTAVASREHVPERVADAIVENAGVETVAVLVANEGAAISESSLSQVVDRFGEDERVQAPLVQRSTLPLTVAERLVALVSQELQQVLVAKHDLPPTLASDLVLQSRERATAHLFAEVDRTAELDRLIVQLIGSGRLTPSLLVRALCMGDVVFFEVAVAKLARIPVENARILIHDSGTLGLKAVYDRSRLPPGLYPVVRAAIAVAHETGFDGEEHDRERHRRKTLERILTQYEFLSMEDSDFDYLLGKLSDLVQPMVT